MSLLFLLGTALILGVRHAFEPDHLVAVSTLAAEERRLWPAARLGLIWGLGHQVPLALLGIPVLALNLHLPEALEHGVDLGVGLILIVLGVRVVWRLRREGVHAHAHAHGQEAHVHFHAHGGHAQGHDHPHPMSGSERQGWLTFGVGLVHGLGGSGAIAVLALAAAPTALTGISYLLIFGVGVCVGMFALTLCLVGPAVSGTARVIWLHRAIRAVAGVASVVLGGYMCYSLLPALLA